MMDPGRDARSDIAQHAICVVMSLFRLSLCKTGSPGYHCELHRCTDTALFNVGHVDTRIGYADTPYPGINYGSESLLNTLLVI